MATPHMQKHGNFKTDDQRNRRRLRIAYVTMRDSTDRRSWSGTLYNMGRALERHCGDVLRIGPLEPLSLKPRKLISQGLQRLTGRTHLYMHSTSLSKKVGRMAEKKLSGQDCDVIFSPVGAGVLAHLRTSIPVVYLSDATVKLLIGYYNEFTGAPSSQIRMANDLEQAAIAKADQLVFPSPWAADSASVDYGANLSKINIVPFGANFDPVPSREEALRISVRDRCRLLFVGVDWQRKGGDIAFETLLEIERLGIPAELTVVGCTPPPNVKHSHLRVFPFLNKNVEGERAQLNQLYYEADFFILPTRAECFSIALCEANAFGIPVLSTETGGLPDLVREGVNGFLFPLEARGDQYALRVRDVFSNATNYQSLRVSSREQFETRLNWDAWGKSLNKILWAAVENSTPSRLEQVLTSSHASLQS